MCWVRPPSSLRQRSAKGSIRETSTAWEPCSAMLCGIHPILATSVRGSRAGPRRPAAASGIAGPTCRTGGDLRPGVARSHLTLPTALSMGEALERFLKVAGQASTVRAGASPPDGRSFRGIHSRRASRDGAARRLLSGRPAWRAIGVASIVIVVGRSRSFLCSATARHHRHPDRPGTRSSRPSCTGGEPSPPHRGLPTAKHSRTRAAREESGMSISRNPPRGLPSALPPTYRGTVSRPRSLPTV
jgi:hypothetical protein